MRAMDRSPPVGRVARWEIRAGPPRAAARRRGRLLACLATAALAVVLGTPPQRACGNSIGTLCVAFDTVDPWASVHVQADLDGDTVKEFDRWFTAGVFRFWLDPKLVPGHPVGDPLGPGLPSSLDAQAIALSATPVYGAGGLQGYKLGTFCCDMVQDVPSGGTTYDVYLIENAPIGAGNVPLGVQHPDKADDLRELFGLDILPAPLLAVSDRYVAEALQACVWEIVYEDRANGYNLSTGDVFVSDVTKATDANIWLARILSEDLDMNEGLRALAREDAQDFVLEIPGLGREPLPEPLTVCGMFLGLVAGAAYVRTRAS